jgi:Zn-dependent peptidase ImmA (M78 family)
MKAVSFPGSNEKIEQVAQALRERFGISPKERLGGTPHLLGLVEKTGGEVTIVDCPAAYEADGGSLVIRGPHDYTIYLSPYTTPLRDNFTIAHELGHVILHYSHRRDELADSLPLHFARYGTDPFEWQANRFAAALLMPKEDVQREFGRVKGDIGLLAGRYGVSVPAVQIRCRSLGLINNS